MILFRCPKRKSQMTLKNCYRPRPLRNGVPISWASRRLILSKHFANWPGWKPRNALQNTTWDLGRVFRWSATHGETRNRLVSCLWDSIRYIHEKVTKANIMRAILVSLLRENWPSSWSSLLWWIAAMKIWIQMKENSYKCWLTHWRFLLEIHLSDVQNKIVELFGAHSSKQFHQLGLFLVWQRDWEDEVPTLAFKTIS